jgi:hypothetical protein
LQFKNPTLFYTLARVGPQSPHCASNHRPDKGKETCKMMSE